MFSRLPERAMFLTRAFLALAWIALILSLIWNPFAADLADGAGQSHVPGHTVLVQEAPMPEAQNPAMAPKVLWAMIIPVLPLFLMVFGHEAWRRICPVSFISQIPRMIGFQHGSKYVNRKTGRIEKRPNLLSKSSPLQKYNYLVQLGFLFIGLVCRLLFANSDPVALFGFLSAIILTALTVGYWFGGKTWCNYFCPIATIQRIYTGPGGLLESKAHTEKTALSKSMCRVSSSDGDKSNCVGCTLNCPDIDLENSYWKSIDNPSRQFTYYSFPGLILGFYGYFYVHSGNWDYYFSGAWTRDETLLHQFFSPGFFAFLPGLAVPKLVAVPLFLIACGSASYLFFLAFEQIYRWFRTNSDQTVTDEVIRHELFTIVAFVSINAFYVFGGRSTILLLPEWAVRVVDGGILFLTSAWLWNTWRRSPSLYQRESMVTSLRQKLRPFGGALEAALEGRKLADLSADEVYSLAKTLPGVLQEQKMAIYERVLLERLDTRHMEFDDGFDDLSELRGLLTVSDSEHQRMVMALEKNRYRGTVVDLGRSSPDLGRVRLHNNKKTLFPRPVKSAGGSRR